MRAKKISLVVGMTLLISPVHAGFMSGDAGDAEVAKLRSVFNEDQAKDIEMASFVLTAHRLCGASHIDEKRVWRFMAGTILASGLPENVFWQHVAKIADLNVREIESDAAKVVRECEVMKKKFGPRDN